MKSVPVLCALLMSIAVSPAWATTYTMGYPPPGGVTFTSSGPGSGADGGKTFSYTGFNSGAYAKLYWDLNAVANVNEGTANGNMVFLNYNATTGIATWVSTSNWLFTSGFGNGCCTTPTQLLVQLQPYTNSNLGFLSSGFLNPTTTKGALGITGDPNEPLYQVTGPYQATFEFEVWDGNTADAGVPTAGDSIFDYNSNNNGGPGVTTSVDFEFWWSYKTTTAKTVQVGTCKTNLQSFPSISAAVGAVTAGAIVDVCPGTYPEQVTIATPLTLQGISSGNANAAVITVPGGGLIQNGTAPLSGPHAAQILVQDVGPVTITGLTVDGSSNNCPPPVNVDGIAYLSNSGTAFGKVTNSSVRNTSNNVSCSQPGNAIYAEGGSSNPLNVQGNTVRGFSGNGISFASNQVGTILSNTIVGGTTGIVLNSTGIGVKATGNSVSAGGSGITLTSATSATVQTNTINGTGTALTLDESGGGGSNIVTNNRVNDATCGISKSNAASSDTFLPNTLLNSVANLCP
ncbi:MAG TPA: NosD domain-containing protein [Terriglobales bacterium]|nr:NosD domain-containing protein [Terriglobales bacterium]